MKSIKLLPRLSTSIEQKLQAEQDAMRMVFILEQSRLEAERKIIDATGERDAQWILAEWHANGAAMLLVDDCE